MSGLQIFSPEMDARIRGLRENGVSWETMSDGLGYTKFILMRRGKDLGLLQPPKNWTAEERAKIAEMIKSGYSNSEIAQAFNRTLKSAEAAAQAEIRKLWPLLHGGDLRSMRSKLAANRRKAGNASIPTPKFSATPAPRGRGILLAQYPTLDKQNALVKRKCLGNFCAGAVFMAPSRFIRLCGTCRSHA